MYTLVLETCTVITHAGNTHHTIRQARSATDFASLHRLSLPVSVNTASLYGCNTDKSIRYRVYIAANWRKIVIRYNHKENKGKTDFKCFKFLTEQRKASVIIV